MGRVITGILPWSYYAFRGYKPIRQEEAMLTDGQKGVETVGACWYAASSHITNMCWEIQLLSALPKCIDLKKRIYNLNNIKEQFVKADAIRAHCWFCRCWCWFRFRDWCRSRGLLRLCGLCLPTADPSSHAPSDACHILGKAEDQSLIFLSPPLSLPRAHLDGGGGAFCGAADVALFPHALDVACASCGNICHCRLRGFPFFVSLWK